MKKLTAGRYLLFTYPSYYPAGGWGDFQGAFATPEEAIQKAVGDQAEIADVVDRETLERLNTDKQFEKAEIEFRNRQQLRAVSC